MDGGAAISVDTCPRDACEADRFVDGHGLVIGGIERLDLAAGRGLVNRELERPAGICWRRTIACIRALAGNISNRNRVCVCRSGGEEGRS